MGGGEGTRGRSVGCWLDVTGQPAHPLPSLRHQPSLPYDCQHARTTLEVGAGLAALPNLLRHPEVWRQQLLIQLLAVQQADRKGQAYCEEQATTTRLAAEPPPLPGPSRMLGGLHHSPPHPTRRLACLPVDGRAAVRDGEEGIQDGLPLGQVEIRHLCQPARLGHAHCHSGGGDERVSRRPSAGWEERRRAADMLSSAIRQQQCSRLHPPTTHATWRGRSSELVAA